MTYEYCSSNKELETTNNQLHKFLADTKDELDNANLSIMSLKSDSNRYTDVKCNYDSLHHKLQINESRVAELVKTNNRLKSDNDNLLRDQAITKADLDKNKLITSHLSRKNDMLSDQVTFRNSSLTNIKSTKIDLNTLSRHSFQNTLQNSTQNNDYISHDNNDKIRNKSEEIHQFETYERSRKAYLESKIDEISGSGKYDSINQRHTNGLSGNEGTSGDGGRSVKEYAGIDENLEEKQPKQLMHLQKDLSDALNGTKNKLKELQSHMQSVFNSPYMVSFSRFYVV